MQKGNLSEQENDALYRNLEVMYLKLNKLVKKAEDVRILIHNVSFQATLQRINTASLGQTSVRAPNAYFPPPSDQESFERKFKLIRRCGHILNDEMISIRSFLKQLHDATSRNKKNIITKAKIENKQAALQFKNENKNCILIDEDDDFIILPKQETNFENKPLLEVSTICPKQYHISCTCQMEEELNIKLPIEIKLWIAMEALQHFEKFELNQEILSICKTNNKIEINEECITYEQIYLNMLDIPTIMLDKQRLKPNELVFFQLYDVQEIYNKHSLFLYGFNQLAKELKDNQLGKSIKFLMNKLREQPAFGTVINLYGQNMNQCQFLIDMIEAMTVLNNNIIIGVNKFVFPESTNNPKILLIRCINKISDSDQKLIEENLESGYRINDKSPKTGRLIIIFSADKIIMPQIGRRIIYSEMPIQLLQNFELIYHFKFMITYIDKVIQIPDKLDKVAKFFVILLSVINSNIEMQYTPSLHQQYNQYVKNRNYERYFQLKLYDPETQQSQLLFEECNTLEIKKIKCRHTDIKRLFLITD